MLSMKVRKGFVSNSSSSSFICDISGKVECGIDLTVSEVDMYECYAGHIFISKYLIMTKEEMKEDIMKRGIETLSSCYPNSTLSDIIVDIDGSNYIPTEYCPICQMKQITNKDYVKYLEKLVGVNKAELLQKIHNQFSDYSDLKTFLKDGKYGY